MWSSGTENGPEIVGRYAVFDQIAAGGMATVHLGRLLGPEGFGRTVAVKRLPPDLVSDKEFLAMFTDEAMIVSRIAHPNVVPTIDIVASTRSLILVMEYVHGESLARLAKAELAAHRKVDPSIACAILYGALLGLHAAHEACGPDGKCLDVVHRDVSPQNIIVGADGVPRVLDFGVAKAEGRSQSTREGQLKGKLAYMAPEQIRGKAERRSDVFAASVVLWELLAGRRLHSGLVDVELVKILAQGKFEPPSAHTRNISPELDRVVLRGLAPNPEERFASAREMASALERAIVLAPARRVGEWVESLAHKELAERALQVAQMERASLGLAPAESLAPQALIDATARAQVDTIPITVEGTGIFQTPAGVAIDRGTTRESSEGAPRPRMRSGVVIAQFLALATCGIVLATVAVFRGRPSPATTDVAPSASHRAPKIAASASAPIRQVADSGAEPLKIVDDDVSPDGAPPANPSHVVNTRRANVHPVVSPPPPPPPPRPNCDPPFTMDEQGHRHYKRECLDE